MRSFVSFNRILCLVLLLGVYFSEFAAFTPSRCIIAKSTRHSSSFNQLSIPKLRFRSNLSLFAQTVDSSSEGGFDLAAWFNPNTRGGVLVWSALLTLLPIAFYQYFISTGIEATTVGAYVGAIFVLLSNLLWASSYVFRVANKDMTYAKQLRDYENAVLQKRLEELADDEINALMEEIELEDKRTPSTSTAAAVQNEAKDLE